MVPAMSEPVNTPVGALIVKVCRCQGYVPAQTTSNAVSSPLRYYGIHINAISLNRSWGTKWLWITDCLSSAISESYPKINYRFRPLLSFFFLSLGLKWEKGILLTLSSLNSDKKKSQDIYLIKSTFKQPVRKETMKCSYIREYFKPERRR